MNRIHRMIAVCSSLLTMTAVLAAADKPATRPARPSSDWTSVTDAPDARIAGAARCPAGSIVMVTILAPSQSVGSTTKTQPTLYWYINDATNYPVEITLTPLGKDGADDHLDPLLDVKLPKVDSKGIQSLSVAKPPENTPPVSLEPGKQYKMVVEVMVNKNDPSQDPVATARLQCISDPDTQAKAAAASIADQYDLYRTKHVWYDMIDSLSQMIAADSTNAGLRQTRQELLQKEKLDEADDGAITDSAK